MDIALKYTGNDNYGKPKKEYLDKLDKIDDVGLLEECKRFIWLSAFANNNPRSDYHWQCDACYDECADRGKINIYEKAWKSASNSI
jgi:hypothetical protein